jgi:flagellar protein FlaI
MFIPPEAKIVSIEDTRELRIPHEHWIPTVTRLGFGIPMPTGEKYGEITLFDLLKGSFRQNPDYAIIGEVRGKEAYVMFQGMSSGHPCMTTFHASSVDTVIKRLITPPIQLSPSLVESLDVIAIMIHAKEKGKSARRIKEVDEVISIKQETAEAETFRSIEWNPSDDTYIFNKDSHLLKEIARNKGTTVEEVIEEISRRKTVLDWMLKNNLKDYVEVCKIVNEYYKNPEKVLKQVGTVVTVEKPKTVEVEKKEQVQAKQEVGPKKIPIPEIFGYKIISEK